MTQDIDWDSINDILLGIEEDLADVEVLSDDDVELEKLSQLTYGLIESDFKSKIQRGNPVWQSAKANQRVLAAAVLAHSVMRMLGTNEVLLPGIASHIRSSRQDLRVVKTAIAGKRASTDFLTSWARLFQLHGFWQSFALDQSEQDRMMASTYLDPVTSRRIKEHWYAYWIYEHAPTLKGDQRRSAEKAIASLCKRIATGELENWKPYPREWFALMVSSQGETLTDRFRQLSADALRGMLGRSLITREVLPPVRLELFALANAHLTPGGENNIRR